MPVYDGIKSRIANFAGYDTEEGRRLADEQIRAYVGERLAAIPLDGLDAATREAYDRALLRCEFLNQQAFVAFESCATPAQIDAVIGRDVRLLDAADRLADDGELDTRIADIDRAFLDRDAAMSAAA